MKSISKELIRSSLRATPLSYIDVWTVQNLSWFHEQFNGEYYTAQWHHKDSFQTNLEEYRTDAYDWLREELPNRIDNWSGEAPIWCWPFKPNIRSYMRNIWKQRKPDWYLIHAKVQRKRMLYSCYDTWHAPLNNAPIVPEEQYDSFKGNPKTTWHHIFNVESTEPWLLNDYGFSRRLQVCVDRIYSTEVVSCDKIWGRKLRRIE